VLGEPLPANGERTDYLRAELRDGRAFASTIQDSSMLRTLARASCLIVRNPMRGSRRKPATRRKSSTSLDKPAEHCINVPSLF
jgi:molybdopterin biosynthesis enzyme